MDILDVRDLFLYYRAARGDVRAVDGVSLTIREGEALGVVGESGCGKTSLALFMMRLQPKNTSLQEGSVIFDGKEVSKLREDEFRSEIRWRKMSMVFQGAMNSLNPVVRVGHQIAEPLVLNNFMSKKEAYLEAMSLMEKVGLAPSSFYRYPHELSGGMKQRVMIAMSLALKPRLVIMDEPTSALDVSVQAQIMNLLKRLKRELRLSIIFITHDIALASDICDKIAVMYSGQIIENGSAEEVLGDPKHPYTQKLLSSVPRLRDETIPEFIPGAPPDLSNPPRGCRFHPRCPYIFELCESFPPLTPLKDVHQVRCWLYEKDKH